MLRHLLLLSIGVILNLSLANGQQITKKKLKNKASHGSFWEIPKHMVKEKLNLSFGQLDSAGIPVTNLPPLLNSSGRGINKFIIKCDSIDKIDGKYSLIFQSDTISINKENKLYERPIGYSGYVGFSIKGENLNNKHIRIEAFLKLYIPGPGYASLFYNTFPQPSASSAHSLYRGIKNLFGVSDWKRYTLEFNTDTITNHIIFGVTVGLIGYGKVNIDKFSVYINNQKVKYDIY